MRRLLIRLTLVLAPIVVIGGMLLFVYSGLYNVAASSQHTPPVYWLLITTLRQSVITQARDIEAPNLEDPVMVRRGLVLYDRDCVVCHGAPGVPLGAPGMGQTPLPANLVSTARTWRAEEIYWTVKHGLKMTGMPGWDYRYTEDDLWAVVAFVSTLPVLAPADYQAARAEIRAVAAEALEPMP